MKPSLLARRIRIPLLGACPVALVILLLVFFFVPPQFRGARLAVRGMKNDVRDWLPSSFHETRELEWFRDHFLGEQFVVVSWPGCSADDPRFWLLVEKLKAECAHPPQPESAIGTTAQPIEAAHIAGAAPAGRPDTASASPPGHSAAHERRDDAAERAAWETKARDLGDELGLFATGDYYEDWGGQGEKWLVGDNDKWYYVTPDGELYRWSGDRNVVGASYRSIERKLAGKRLDGTYLATFGHAARPGKPNPFHNDPRKLTARYFKTVTTGPEVLARLAGEGGTLRPRGESNEEVAADIARREAIERLEGTLFGPQPPGDFHWTTADLQHVLGARKLAELPEGWEATFDAFVQEVADEHYGGDVEALKTAPREEREAHWLALFGRLGVSPPARQTCIVVTLSDAAKRDLSHVLGRPIMGKPQGRILALSTGECGIAAEDLKMGGPPVDNVAIDEEGSRTLMRLVTYSAIVGLGLAYLCFRSFKVTFFIFFVGGVAAVTSLSLVWWTGGSVDAVLLSMPSLVYVLGLSGAVHIVNYYREAADEGPLEAAPWTALRQGWWPCLLCALTTALGLISLCTSNLVPIRKFGFYAALGTLATVLLICIFLPAALQMWPCPRRKNKRAGSAGDGSKRAGSVSDGRSEDTLHKCIQNFWEWIGAWIVRRHWWVTAACTVVMIVFAFGLWRINTSVKLLKLFDGDAKIIRDYEWMEANQGKLVPMEVVLRARPAVMLPTTSELESAQERDLAHERVQLNFLERMEIADRIYKAVEREFGEDGLDVVGRGMLASTFVEDLPEPNGSFRSTRGAFNGRLEAHREELLHSDYLRIDKQDGSELWRISLRLGALNDVDYGEFVGQLQRVIEPILAGYRCRQEVLISIESQRGDASATVSATVSAGASVLVLGGPLPKESHAASEAGGHDTNVSHQTSAGNSLNEVSIDQSALFAETLRDLLINRGFLEPTAAQPDPKRRLQWHVPEMQPLDEAFPTRDALAAELERYDCVVLARDHADYDVAFLKEHARVFVDARDHQFDPKLHAALTANKRGDNVSVVYTGLVPIVYKAQRTLLNSLIMSVAMAFLTISPVMMILLRSGKLSPTNFINPGAGLVAMVPNVFPLIMVFGAIGYLGVMVDVGTMMTASVAMGVAVDDTIHFLNWYRRGLAQGLDRRQAILASLRHVGTAMTQTALIGGLGLSVFALSTFTPTQRFGVMMLIILPVALVGDLVFLTALLAGPLGKFFAPSDRAKKKGDAGDKEAPSSLELRPHTAIGTTHEGVPAPHGTPAPHRKAGRSRTAGDRAWRHDDGHGRRNQN